MSNELSFNQLSRWFWWMNMQKLGEEIPHPERGSVDFELSSFFPWWVGSATWSLRCLLKCCQGVEQGDSLVSVVMMKGVSSYSKCHLCLQKVPMSDKRELIWPILGLEQKVNTCPFSTSSWCSFWLTLYNLVSVVEDLQIRTVCELGGLCTCDIFWF